MTPYCKHWRELDTEYYIYEYCQARRRKCTCAGVYAQCNYLDYFNAAERRIAKLLRRDRTIDTAEKMRPFVKYRGSND